MKTIPEPEISGNIQQMEFDEMWHFIEKSPKLQSIKALDRRRKRLLPELQVILMWQPLVSYSKNSSI